MKSNRNAGHMAGWKKISPPRITDLNIIVGAAIGS